MINVFALHIGELVDHPDFLQYLTPGKARPNWLPVKHSLYGELLLRAVLCQVLGLKNKEIVFTYNRYGKPRLVNEQLNFNLSHSGDWVVCSLDKLEVGIDIQRVEPLDISIAYHYFTRQECEQIFNQPESQRLDYFFQLWTLKESYIKLQGKGLSLPLNSFCIKKDQQHIFRVYSQQRHPEPVFFKQYNLQPEYQLAVCALNPTFAHHVFQLNFNEILLAIQQAS